MIVVDKSETNKRSLLPEIEDARVSPNLEELTGADLMITTLTIPAHTQSLLEKHRDHGALFVQGKWSASDLEASVIDGRLAASLARMLAFKIPTASRILLLVGETPVVGSREWSALSKFLDRGGRVEPPLKTWDQIPQWCKLKEQHLAEYRKNPIQWVFTPDETFVDNGMFQIPIEVPKSDPRRVLIQCPGIGPALATRWWDEVKVCLPLTATLFDVLAWMSWEDPKAADLPQIEGYGPKKRAACRQWLGLTTGVNLALTGKETK